MKSTGNYLHYSNPIKKHDVFRSYILKYSKFINYFHLTKQKQMSLFFLYLLTT